jgi:hypothetical protein
MLRVAVPGAKAIVSMGRGGCAFAVGAVAWLAGVNIRQSPAPPDPIKSMSNNHHHFRERGDGGGIVNSSSRFETETWESEVCMVDTAVSIVNV